MSERHQIVRDLFESCLEHQNPAAFLADHCFDPTVRQEVEALLSAHNRASSFLESPPTLPTSDAPRQWVGSRLGVYELLEEIGGGGMGRVFLAVRADDAYRKQVQSSSLAPASITRS